MCILPIFTKQWQYFYIFENYFTGMISGNIILSRVNSKKISSVLYDLFYLHKSMNKLTVIQSFNGTRPNFLLSRLENLPNSLILIKSDEIIDLLSNSSERSLLSFTPNVTNRCDNNLTSKKNSQDSRKRYFLV